MWSEAPCWESGEGKLRDARTEERDGEKGRGRGRRTRKRERERKKVEGEGKGEREKERGREGTLSHDVDARGNRLGENLGEESIKKEA